MFHLKDLKIKTSPVSLKFIICSFILIFLVGVITLGIFAWINAYLLEYATTTNEGILAQSTSSNLDSLLRTDQVVLQNAYLANTLSPSLSKYFDVGVVQEKSGKLSSISFNAAKFSGLANFEQTISSETNNFYINSQYGIIIVTFIDPTNPANFSIGALDATGSIMKDLLSSSFHAFLIDQNGNVLYTNTKGVSPEFIPSLHLNVNDYEQVKIGNFRREILTYSPLTTVPLGVAYLSDPFINSILSFTEEFGAYLTLLGICLFLAFIIVFSVLVDIPLSKVLNFFADYDKGKIRQIQVKSGDSFSLLATYINDLIKKLTSDYQRIGKADEIQDDFLKLSGHLLRTPINSIQGYTDLLDAQNRDPKLTEGIKNIQNAVNKLAQLEENILAISQENTDIINAPIETCDTREILEQSYKMTQEDAKKKNLTYIIDTSLLQGAMIQVNRNNVVQAVNNLIDNAIKFTPEGGSIKLYGRMQDNRVTISVSDTGIGLTKEEIEVIFNKFSRISDTMEYNSEGLGIGLYVVKTIVETYGGKVWVDSIKGSGSIFNISLPLAS